MKIRAKYCLADRKHLESFETSARKLAEILVGKSFTS